MTDQGSGPQWPGQQPPQQPPQSEQPQIQPEQSHAPQGAAPQGAPGWGQPAQAGWQPGGVGQAPQNQPPQVPPAPWGQPGQPQQQWGQPPTNPYAAQAGQQPPAPQQSGWPQQGAPPQPIAWPNAGGSNHPQWQQTSAYQRGRPWTSTITLLGRVSMGLLGLNVLLRLYAVYFDLSVKSAVESSDYDNLLSKVETADRLSNLNIILTVITAIAFVTWFGRAYASDRVALSAKTVGNVPATITWLIPVVTWFVPPVTLRAMWNGVARTHLDERGTQAADGVKVTRADAMGFPIVIGAWAACWFLGFVVTGVSRSQTNDGDLSSLTTEAIGHLFFAGAAVLLIVIIQRLQKMAAR